MMSAVRALALILIAGAAAAQTMPDGVLGGPIGGTPAPVLWPVDEAASRADFFAFRATLQAALARQDLNAVLAVVAPDIKNSFFVILPMAKPDPPHQDVREWAAVRTGDRTAYVAASLVRSPVDYRAFFERRDGGWQLVTFAAGD